jgi:hypothetical protein
VWFIPSTRCGYYTLVFGFFCNSSALMSRYFPIFFLGLLFSSGSAFKASLAFKEVTTFLPVLSSNSNLATLATLPPCLATFLFSSKSFGLVAAEISFV